MNATRIGFRVQGSHSKVRLIKANMKVQGSLWFVAAWKVLWRTLAPRAQTPGTDLGKSLDTKY